MSSVPVTKRCSKCGRELPVDDFYVKNRRTGRRQSACKSCHTAQTTANYHAGGEDARALRREYGRAHKDERSDYAAAYREANREKLAAYNKAYDAANAERVKARRAAYREAKREVIRAKGKEYREQNRDAINARARDYRRRLGPVLKERLRAWRLANPEKYRQIHRKWKRFHKDAVNASTHKRRSRLSGCTENYTVEQWQALKVAQDYSCLLCGRREPEIQLTVDHVVPVSRGGGNSIDNICGLCKSCNSVKHAREFDPRPAHLRPSSEE